MDCGKETMVVVPFEITVADEGLFLLRVWHEGGEGDVWGYALARIMPDDTVDDRRMPGINELGDVVVPRPT
jgi:hypothetical protein